MRFLILFVSICLSIGLSLAALDHLPDSNKFNRLTGDKVSIERGRTVAYRKRKRDYASTLELLKAAVASYQQANVPPQEVVAPVQEVVPPPVEETAPPPPTEEVAPPPPTEETVPTQEVVSPPPSEQTEPSPAPPTADIEEDDKFDPEEDPDDVDDPPLINGIPTQREE